MDDRFSRTQLLLGEEALKKLSAARVAVFGVGGVGGYTVEALARSGVGEIDIIDDDTINITNINRQIIALESTISKYKVEVAKERILSINPECRINAHRKFYLPENSDEFDFTQYDYVVDAIDTVTGKIGIIMQAKAAGVPVISSMGAGNKLDPTAFEVADIYQTSVCPLAKVMRREMKKRGVRKLKVVYSREEPIRQLGEDNGEAQESSDTRKGKPKRYFPGSVAFVPSVVGLIIAGEVIKDIAGIQKIKSRQN